MGGGVYSVTKGNGYLKEGVRTQEHEITSGNFFNELHNSILWNSILGINYICPFPLFSAWTHLGYCPYCLPSQESCNELLVGTFTGSLQWLCLTLVYQLLKAIYRFPEGGICEILPMYVLCVVEKVHYVQATSMLYYPSDGSLSRIEHLVTDP